MDEIMLQYGRLDSVSDIKMAIEGKKCFRLPKDTYEDSQAIAQKDFNIDILKFKYFKKYERSLLDLLDNAYPKDIMNFMKKEHYNFLCSWIKESVKESDIKC